MRLVLAFLAMTCVAAGTSLRPESAAQVGVVHAAAQAPPAVPPAEPTPPQPSPLALEGEQARESGWGATAVWISIGMVALVLLAVAVILSVRGGGRTVLKE